MKKKDVELLVSEIRTFLRDFKIQEVMQEKQNKIEIVTPKKSIFSFLYKGLRKQKQLDQLGAIVTGSRALSMYRINGESLITRKPDDWDYLLDKKSFLKFCGLNNLTNIKYGQDRITVNFTSGVYVGDYGYGSPDPQYIFKHEFDIISKEKLPISIRVNNFNVATLESILHEKLEIIESNGYTSGKHLQDCIQVMTKLEAYGK